MASCGILKWYQESACSVVPARRRSPPAPPSLLTLSADWRLSTYSVVFKFDLERLIVTNTSTLVSRAVALAILGTTVLT